jgi:hypothetical protein
MWPELEEDNVFYEHLNIQKDKPNESMMFDFDAIDEEGEYKTYSSKGNRERR